MKLLMIPEGIFDWIDVVDENSRRVSYDRETYDLVMLTFDTSSSLMAYKHCARFRKTGEYRV